MRSFRGSLAMIVFTALAGCSPAPQSDADTAVAGPASSSQSTFAGEADTGSPVKAGGGGTSSAPSATEPVARSNTANKSPATSKPQTKVPAARDDSIIGYDSVIRFPIRTLPRADSTLPRR
ncbi:MAG: hypothetical protein WD802_01960 [Gemmatimonadaceae bacterium]